MRVHEEDPLSEWTVLTLGVAVRDTVWDPVRLGIAVDVWLEERDGVCDREVSSELVNESEGLNDGLGGRERVGLGVSEAVGVEVAERDTDREVVGTGVVVALRLCV